MRGTRVAVTGWTQDASNGQAQASDAMPSTNDRRWVLIGARGHQPGSGVHLPLLQFGRWLKRRAPCREPSEQPVQPLQVIDHAPAPTAALDLLAPGFHASEIFAGIEVVGAELCDIERDDVEALEVERHLAHVALGKIFLEIGEDQDFLA